MVVDSSGLAGLAAFAALRAAGTNGGFGEKISGESILNENAPTNLFPGVLVRHPFETDWGMGQVQSVVGARVTVNFEHRGKVLINTDVIDLVVVDEENGAP